MVPKLTNNYLMVQIQGNDRICPRCNSTRIGDVDEPLYDNGTFIVSVSCPDCGLVWMEHYQLTSVEIVKEEPYGE